MNENKIVIMPLEKLVRSPLNLRETFPEIDSLAQSMKAYGIVEELKVRPWKEDPTKFEVVGGERRRQAAELASIKELPCILVNWDDRQTLLYMLVEDEQSKGLNSIEKAKGYTKALEIDFTPAGDRPVDIRTRDEAGQFESYGKISMKELGEIIGRSEDVIRERIRIARGLPQELWKDYEEGGPDKEVDVDKLTHKKALILARAEIPKEDKINLAKKTLKEGLTEDQVRKKIADGKKVEEVIERIPSPRLREEYKHSYLEDENGIGKYNFTPEEIQEDYKEELGIPTGLTALERMELFRQKVQNLVNLATQEGATTEIISSDINKETDEWVLNLKWTFKVTKGEAVQESHRFFLAPVERFGNYDLAEDWARARGGYCTTINTVKTGKGEGWQLALKQSKLSDKEKKELIQL